MPWYKQTTVWAVIISVVAIVFSQVPPIITWIPRDDLKVEIGSRIDLPNNIGIPGYQFLIDLENNGNRSRTVSSFRLEVVYPSGKAKLIFADSYVRLSAQSVIQKFAITTIKLDAGGGWSETVLFHPQYSPTEEEEMYHLEMEITQSISAKIQSMADKYRSNIMVEADERLVAEAKSFFNRTFDLEKGTYKVSLICDMAGQKTTLKKFEFTLYDYHISTLKAQTEDYKYGWGINASTESTKQVDALISKID